MFYIIVILLLDLFLNVQWSPRTGFRDNCSRASRRRRRRRRWLTDITVFNLNGFLFARYCLRHIFLGV